MSATRNASLTPTNDTFLEGPETVGLVLGTLATSGTANGAGNTANDTTIVDNESATLDIATTSTVAEESGAQDVGVVTLTIMGTGIGTFSLAPASCCRPQRRRAGGTAVSGTDYTAFGLAGHASTIARCDERDRATRNASLTPTNDTYLEGPETVGLVLGTLGAQRHGDGAGQHGQHHHDRGQRKRHAGHRYHQHSGGRERCAGRGRSHADDRRNGTGTFSLGAGIVLSAAETQSGGTAVSGTDYTAFGPQAISFNNSAGATEIVGAMRNASLTPTNDTYLEGRRRWAWCWEHWATSGTATVLGNTANTTTIVDNESATLDIATTSTVRGSGRCADRGRGDADDQSARGPARSRWATGIVCRRRRPKAAGRRSAARTTRRSARSGELQQ